MKNRLIHLLFLTAALAVLSSCQWMHDDYADYADDAAWTGDGRDQLQQFINLTISVVGDGPALTRAPQGGENGDGREAGFERENAVSLITLILTDKPLADDAARIVFKSTYPVTRVSTATAGSNPADPYAETQYTTGNQRVSHAELDLFSDKDYHALVLANVISGAAVGDLVATALRDATAGPAALHSGNAFAPDACRDFAMTSEHETTINFTKPADCDIDDTSEEGAIYFTVKHPFVIERMAARIDFCTAYAANTKNAPYGTYGDDATKGFRYDYADGTPGFFVLESMVPFNVSRNEEYLFKRVTSDFTTLDYLGLETTTNLVVDPATTGKVAGGGEALTMVNPVADPAEPNWASSPYLRTAESLSAQQSRLRLVSTTTDDDFVVAYTMENTLLAASPLKPYATGLAVTGSYYNAEGHRVARRTFYGYLRHQGEGTTAYDAYEWGELPNEPVAGAPAMNFGVVRNNIYRVAIESVDAAKGRIRLKMTVNDWRNVTHKIIYV